FQAEDAIRDRNVTGVQTCALPILTADAAYPEIYPMTVAGARGRGEPAKLAVPASLTRKWPALTSLEGAPAFNVGRAYSAFAADKIGRASCRGRGGRPGGAG